MKRSISTALLLPRVADQPIEEYTSEEYQALIQHAPKKQNKFKAKVTWVDGIRFASQGEATRYSQLKIRERAGEITDLELQVEYSLDVNGLHIATYMADFVYIENGQKVVEDFKGVRTRLYILKAKLMKALHGITIYETGRRQGRQRRVARRRKVIDA